MTVSGLVGDCRDHYDIGVVLTAIDTLAPAVVKLLAWTRKPASVTNAPKPLVAYESKVVNDKDVIIHYLKA